MTNRFTVIIKRFLEDDGRVQGASSSDARARVGEKDFMRYDLTSDAQV